MPDTDNIKQEIQSLTPTAMLELFVLDLSPIQEDGDIYHFHAGTNEVRNPITWQGEIYSAWPIEVSGFDLSVGGKFPRPRIKVSNVNGLLSALVLSFNDLVGAKILRKRTFAKFLDDINFEGGVNPSGAADANDYISDDIYFIERKVLETRELVDFELVSIMDLEGVMLPRRQVNTSVCPFLYRGTDCSYAGDPVAERDDTPIVVTLDYDPFDIEEWSSAASYTVGNVVWYVNTRRLFVAKGTVPVGTVPTNTTHWWEDRCGKLIASCELRFGANGELSTGAFPGALRFPNL